MVCFSSDVKKRDDLSPEIKVSDSKLIGSGEKIAIISLYWTFYCFFFS